MKRASTRTFAAFVMLGVIVNIGVAWTVALCFEWTEHVPKEQRANFTWFKEGPLKWPDGAPSDWSLPTEAREEISAFYTTDVLVAATFVTVKANGVYGSDYPRIATSMTHWRQLECGWPMRSLASERFSSRKPGAFGMATTSTPHPLSVWRQGIKIPKTLVNTARINGDQIPIRPVWLGFLVNSGLYSLILFAFWRSPMLVRKAVRRRRGHCPHCNYDRHGITGVCPECGKA